MLLRAPFFALPERAFATGRSHTESTRGHMGPLPRSRSSQWMLTSAPTLHSPRQTPSTLSRPCPESAAGLSSAQPLRRHHRLHFFKITDCQFPYHNTSKKAAAQNFRVLPFV